HATTTCATLTHMYASTCTLNVVLAVKDSGSPQQTANSQQTLIVTNSPPPLTTGFSHAPSSPEAGQQVTFTASASGGSTLYNFSWSFGDRSAASGNPSLHTYTSSGSYMVIVTVRDVNGGVANSSQTVTVATAPTVSFTYNPVSPDPSSPVTFTNSPASPEAEQAVTFTATETGGVGNVSLSWDFGDNSSSTENPTTHTYTTSGSFLVSVTVTNAYGVSTTSTGTVNVVASLGASLTFSPSSPHPVYN